MSDNATVAQRQHLCPLRDAERELSRQMKAQQGEKTAPMQRARMSNLVIFCNSLEQSIALNEQVPAIECVHLVSRAEVAEAAKLFENVFRSVNIALVNELKLIAHEQGLDPWEVLDAAATKPFGFLPFAPGPGMGGHCIPKDPHYYAWAAEAAGVRSRFVALADETNRAMPAYVCERTRAALFERSVELAGARVLLLGLAYKAEVGIVAESPALALAELFHARAARVSFSDPHVASVPQSSRACFESARSLEFDLEVLAGFDALVVCTDHQAFDWELIARTDVLVIDTRNALALRMRGRANYRRA